MSSAVFFEAVHEPGDAGEEKVKGNVVGVGAGGGEEAKAEGTAGGDSQGSDRERKRRKEIMANGPETCS